MPNYDSGVTYDSGVFYDAPTSPSSTVRKSMAKVKLNLGSLNVDQKLVLGNNIKTSMTGNANFTTPNPTLVSYGTTITTLTTKNALVVSLQAQLKTAMSDRNAAEVAFDQATTQMASYVENTSGGDPVKIESAGMSVRAGRSPVAIPDQVTNLSATAGDADGEVDLQWDPVTGAKSYEVMISPDPVTPTSWLNRPSVTKSKAVITGQTSGARMWFKVRAIGAGGHGAYSDPATKIVP